MTTATAKKSLTVLELLGTNTPEGTQAKVMTDNQYYGTTVVKHGGALLNVRNNTALPLTQELLQTKFKIVETETNVSLHAFLVAYDQGKKVKIELGDKFRTVEKRQGELPEEIKKILSLLPVKAVEADEVITFEELLQGKFYIINE
jgi:hypothetical protein